MTGAAYRLRSRGPGSWFRSSALLALLLGVGCAGAPASAAGLEGLSVEEAIARLEAQGLEVIYSSDLVTPELQVLAEPSPAEPAAMLRDILRPHGLDLAPAPSGQLMVVRGAPAPSAVVDAVEPQELTEIIVTASRYRFQLRPVGRGRDITAQDLELLPELADDPVRSVARLPGVARQDFSSKPTIRGGVSDETLVRFDGLRLYDPYHLKDFQSLTSAIDPNVVDAMTIFTAGFPVTYGDRLSGVMDILPVGPGEAFGGRIAASAFNLSALLGGPLNDGRGEWLAAVRRGNLDLVLDVVNPDLGQPRYGDVYARLGYQVGDGLHVAAKLLVSDDDLTVFDSDQEEEAVAEYRDEYYWLTFDVGDSVDIGGRVQLGRSRLSSRRTGVADLPGVASGRLDDRRNFTIDTLSADGWWSLGSRHGLEAGIEWRGAEGHYDYSDQAAFDLLFLVPGAPREPTRTRQLSVNAEGDHFAAYANWRFDLTDTLTTDLGLRWDRETLSSKGSDLLGPRVGLLWEPGSETRFRFAWGQFFQAQGINELWVSDGDPRIYPGQNAEHWVLSFEKELADRFELRLEAYRKEYGNLRPRYENLLNTLVVLPELKPDRLRIAPKSARADGLEASLNYLDGPLTGWLNYSWASVEDRLQGGKAPRSWDQTHAVGAGASYRGNLWDLTLAAAWHSGWPTTETKLAVVEPFPLVTTGSRNAERLGNYLRFDARVARRFQIDPSNLLTVFFEVSNVTNRRNDCCVEYQLEEDGSTQYLDVAVVESLPLIPSIGFVWSF